MEPSHLIYDPQGEYDPSEFGRDRVYRPTDDPNSETSQAEELDLLIRKVVKPMAMKGKLNLFVIDETDLPCPNGERPPFYIRDMISSGRHWSPTGDKGLTVAYVFRRPCEVYTRIIELADYRIIFTLTGRNDRKYLSDLLVGFDDTVFELPEYHFAIHHRRDSEGHDYDKCRPVPLTK